MKFLNRRNVVACIAIALLVFGFFAKEYRRYAYAFVWHRFHGDRIDFSGHRLSVPKLWWPVTPERAGEVAIMRAFRPSAIYEPMIEVTPIPTGQTVEGDNEVARVANAVVSRLNRDPSEDIQNSVVSLRSKNSIWYCTKFDLAVFGSAVSSTLNCYASKLPFTLYYTGPPEQEREAEAIFATFE